MGDLPYTGRLLPRDLGDTLYKPPLYQLARTIPQGDTTMNVHKLGPITELSSKMKVCVKANNLYRDGDWYLVVQLLEDHTVQQEIIIDKFKVGAPYKLRINGILQAERSVLQAKMNDYVMLICTPTSLVKPEHQLEVQRSMSEANRFLSPI